MNELMQTIWKKDESGSKELMWEMAIGHHHLHHDRNPHDANVPHLEDSSSHHDKIYYRQMTGTPFFKDQEDDDVGCILLLTVIIIQLFLDPRNIVTMMHLFLSQQTDIEWNGLN